MKFKTFQFNLAPSGIQEDFEEKDMSSGPFPYLLFIDPIDQNSPEDVEMAKEIITCAIEESLGGKTIDETSCTEAFKIAHKSLHRHFNRAFPTSVVLVTENSSGLLIMGAGDARVYSIRPDKRGMLFSDPGNSYTSSDLTPSERLEQIKNAVGHTYPPHLHTKQSSVENPQRFVIASFGAYCQCSNREIFGMGAQPHSPKHGVATTFSGKSSEGHGVSTSILTSTSSSTATQTTTTSTSSSKPQYVALGLSLATCALIFLISFALLTDSSKETTTPNTTASSPTPPSSAAINDLVTNNIELQKQVISQSDYIDKLQDQIESFVAQNNESTLTAHVGDELVWEERLQQKSEEAEALQQEIQSLQEQIQALEESAATAIPSDADELTDEILTLKQAISDFEDQEQMLIQDRDQLEALLSKTQEETKELAQHSKALGTRLQILEEELLIQNEELTELENLRSTNLALTQKNQELEEKTANIASTYESKEEAFAQMSRSLKQEAQEQEEIKTRYTAHLENLSDRLEEAEQVAGILQQQNEELLIAKTEVEDQLVAFAELEEKYEAERALRITQEELYTKLSEELEEKEQIIALSSTSSASLAQELEDLKDEKRELLTSKAEILQALQELETTKQRYDALQAAQREQTIAYENMKQELEYLKQNRASSSTTQQATATPFTPPEPTERTLIAETTSAGTTSVGTSGRIHVVREGETLTGIAYRYYGSARRWKEIYQANADAISNKHNIQVGTELVVPE